MHPVITCVQVHINYHHSLSNYLYETKEQVLIYIFLYFIVPLFPAIMVHGDPFHFLLHLHHPNSYEEFVKKVEILLLEYYLPHFIHLPYPSFLH